MSLSIEERFWSKVKIAGPNECWEWQASRVYGYGKFWANGREYRAHRMSWELAYGVIPDELLVCHTCDNHACVNPAHLFLGTNQDNTDDMIQKGRYRGGELHPSKTHPESRPKGKKVWCAKLVDGQVNEIRNRYVREKVSQRLLAREYNVSQAVINDILLRKIWKHI